MIETAVVRLLYEGLPPIGEQDATALPFSPEQLAASPLALPEDLTAAGGRPCAEAPGQNNSEDAGTARAVTPCESLHAQEPAKAGGRHMGTFCTNAPCDKNTAGCGTARAAEKSPGAPSPWTACEKNGVRWLELPAPGLPGPLYITGPATSTLDVARLLVQAGIFPEWASVLSLSQSAGRGQMRRAWSSPAGNIYSALRLPLAPPFDSAAAAPACGALFAEALTAEGCPVLLKWPNDILQAGPSFRPGTAPGRNDCFKVGGMLMEERNGALIAGTGFNLTSFPPASTLRDNYAFSAGILRRENGSPLVEPHPGNSTENSSKSKDIVTIFTLWIRLASRLFSCYSLKQTLKPWWPALAQRHLAFRGCRVTLADACPERETMVRIPCEGVVDGVTDSGALRLSTAFGTETFLGGSILPADGNAAREHSASSE